MAFGNRSFETPLLKAMRTTSSTAHPAVNSANVMLLDGPLPWPLVVLLSIPAVAIILLTVFGNFLVLCFKARVGRTNTTLLVWNLGLTDFLVGLIVLPLGAIHLIHRKWIFGRLLCRIWVAVDVTFCTCSVVTICIISVDRYLAVTRPLRYKSVVTKCKVISVIVLIWSFSLGILLATVRWDYEPEHMEHSADICFAGHEIRYLAHSVVFAFFLPASVTLTLYWRIYKLARNRQKALDRGFLMILGHNMNFLTNTLSQATALRVHIGKNNGLVEHQRRVLRTHERIAKTLGVVSCSFLFCWLPFFTLYLANYKCDGCIPTAIVDVVSWLGYCNSMINPIIYSFTVKEFKRSAHRTILPMWRLVHRYFPRFVTKPPDARQMGRMARRQQQVATKTKTTPLLEQQRRRGMPGAARTHPKGATAMLMRGVNATLPQTPLLGERRGKIERQVAIDVESTVGHGAKRPSSIVEGVEDDRTSASRTILGNGTGPHKWETDDVHDDIDDDLAAGEEQAFKREGLVTTTLLLATSQEICNSNNHSINENTSDGERIKSSCSSLSSESFLSPAKAIRMPCKVPVKRLKRHSLPNVASLGVPSTNSSMIESSSTQGRWRKTKERRNSLFRSLFQSPNKPEDLRRDSNLGRADATESLLEGEGMDSNNNASSGPCTMQNQNIAVNPRVGLLQRVFDARRRFKEQLSESLGGISQSISQHSFSKKLQQQQKEGTGSNVEIGINRGETPQPSGNKILGEPPAKPRRSMLIDKECLQQFVTHSDVSAISYSGEKPAKEVVELCDDECAIDVPSFGFIDDEEKH